jgi:hypothetical protein
MYDGSSNIDKEYVIGTAVFVVRKGFITCRTLEAFAYFSRRSKAEAFIAKELEFWKGIEEAPVYDIRVIKLDVFGEDYCPFGGNFRRRIF